MNHQFSDGFYWFILGYTYMAIGAVGLCLTKPEIADEINIAWTDFIASIKTSAKEVFGGIFKEGASFPLYQLPSCETIGWYSRDGISTATILWDGRNITANPPMAVRIVDTETGENLVLCVHDEVFLLHLDGEGKSTPDLGPETTLRILLDLGGYCTWRPTKLDAIKRTLYIK